MKTIASLIRLHKWELEQKRRELVFLQGEENSIIKEKNQLENNLKNEQKFIANDIDLLRLYGNYAQYIIQEREKLESELKLINKKMIESRIKVGEAYQDLKKYEIFLNNLEEKMNKKLQNIENIEADEISIEMFRRSQA
tara:strand:- start:5384 stop:5800 length:417 start_codon:yes stop_codon:yes gene_type:complete